MRNIVKIGIISLLAIFVKCSKSDADIQGDIQEDERDILIELYDALGGDDWLKNSGWKSDLALDKWYGVDTDSNGSVVSINLANNNLEGELSSSIGGLSNLHKLDIGGNNIGGKLPLQLGTLNKLESIILSQNRFTGSIPMSLQQDADLWNKIAWTILQQQDEYGFNSGFEPIYISPTTVTTIDGKTINMGEFWASNELTCVIQWQTQHNASALYLATINSLYNQYSSQGFNVISFCNEDDVSKIRDYVNSYNIVGEVFQIQDNTNHIATMPTSPSLIYAIVDKSGKILHSESIYQPTTSFNREQATIDFVTSRLTGQMPIRQYESADYSQNGTISQLQHASRGNGIDVVIMGDGFADSDMTSGGEYERRMTEAMEHFFSEEPFKSFRDRYNVYMVKVVSPNDGIGEGKETALSSRYEEGTAISGDYYMIFSYAKKVRSLQQVDNLTIINVVNSPQYGGTSYMYSSGASISFCPIISGSSEEFRKVIVHEAAGHGFGKLIDEYVTHHTDTAPASHIARIENYHQNNWAANIDYTNDPSQVRWAHQLSDPRYSGLVGIYEGAFLYGYGVYRPSQQSIMRYNVGGFNSPSREEIYRRIMVQSGEEFSYENFALWDAINRTPTNTSQALEATTRVDESVFIPFAPPIFIQENQ